MNTKLSLYDHVARGDYDTKLSIPDGKWALPEYADMLIAIRADEGRLNDLFKADLFEAFGVTDNPKRELCWEKAWSFGHSAGRAEVLSYFEELVDLIR